MAKKKLTKRFRKVRASQRSGAVGFSLGKKVVFSVLAVLLMLCVLEGGLALVGVHPELYEADPYVGFSSDIPLFVQEKNANGEIWMVTAKNRLAFLNSQRFPMKKGDGAYRIFVMGGSTTYGHPYDDTTSFCGWLREFLMVGHPERQWEVINAGGISYGSYRVARLMEEFANYKPDLFIVYSGHNEFLEKRIYGQVTKMPRSLNGLTRLAWQSRAASLVKRGFGLLRRNPEASRERATVLENEPVTLLDNTLGPTAYTRDETLRQQILEHFRFNIGRMIDIAQSVGARILFVNPASNLREVSPFKSEHRVGLSAEETRLWGELLNQARHDFANPVPTNGLAALEEAALIDNLPSDLHFAKARILEKLGRFVEARASYIRARDEDVCPLRAPSEVGQILEQVTSERRVPLIDFEAFVEAHSENGIPGASLFLDHVHLTIDGYRMLALEILGEMEREGIVLGTLDLTQTERAVRNVMGRIDSQSHAFALMNLCKTLGWAGKREEAYRAGVKAVELAPTVPKVRYEAGLAAQLTGRTNEAILHYSAVVASEPFHAEAQCALGVVLEDTGRLAEAIEHYKRAVEFGKAKDAERNRSNLEAAMAKLSGKSQAGD